MGRPSTRRRFLRRCGTALAIGLAGCLASERSGHTPESTPTEPPTGTPPQGTNAETPPTSSPSDTGTPDASPSDEQSALQWREPLGSSISHPPAIAGDTAYVGTESGTVHAMAIDDGSGRWSFETGRSIRGRPVVTDGTVFVVSGTMEFGSNHEVYALDAATGRERWRFAPDSWWLDLIGVTETTLYVGTADDAIANEGQTLYALATDAGTRRWAAEIGDPSGGLVAGETVYVPSYGRLYAYDAADGTRRWTKDVTDYSFRTLAATDDSVFYIAETSGTRGGLFALDAETGETTWSSDDWLATSTTLHDGTLYVGGEHVAAFDPATGERRWQVDAPGFVPRVPVREGVLYAGGDRLRAYSIDDGALRWSWSSDPTVQGTIPRASTPRTVYVDTFREDDPRNRYKFAVDARTGEQRWVFDGETELTELTLGDGSVLVGGDDGVVYALGSV